MSQRLTSVPGALLIDPKPTHNRQLATFLMMCGDAFFSTGVFANAKVAYELAINADRESAHAHHVMGRMALREKRYVDAAAHFKHFLRLVPEEYSTLINMALVRIAEREFDAARHFTTRAIDAGKKAECLTYEPFFLLCAIYNEMGEYDLEREAIDLGLRLFPDCPLLRDARSTWNLLHRHWPEGWHDYEFRKRKAEAFADLDDRPEWGGALLEDRSLLILGEQGFGDYLMFSRWLPLVRLNNPEARIVFYCRPELARLFEGSFLPNGDLDAIITSNAEMNRPEFNGYDVWCSLASLPYMLEEPVPPEPVQMLAPIDSWHRIAPLVVQSDRLKVGICWRGNPQHERDKYRSMDFHQVAPLLDIEGCDFYSLQFGVAVEHVLINGSPLTIRDLASSCVDVADMAAAVQEMDLVITVDTSIAHLAGVVGKPVWMFCYEPCDWRWGIRPAPATVSPAPNDGNPWYPSLKLYRQAEPLLWAPVVEQMKTDLAALVEETKQKARVLPAKLEPMPETSLASTRYGPMLHFTEDNWCGRSLALYGEWSEPECELFRQILKAGDTVVEAGAHVGAHTVPMLQMGAVVHGFEPNYKAYDLLLQNVGATRLTAATFNPQPYALGRYKGSGFGLRTTPNNPGGTCLDARVVGDVAVATLDGLQLKSLKLLKADVEGMELDILQGGEETIARCRPLLYLEDDRPEKSAQLHAWLIAHGYFIYQHWVPLYNPENFNGYRVNVFGQTVSMNILCLPRERQDVLRDLRGAIESMQRVRG